MKRNRPGQMEGQKLLVIELTPEVVFVHVALYMSTMILAKEYQV